MVYNCLNKGREYTKLSTYPASKKIINSNIKCTVIADKMYGHSWVKWMSIRDQSLVNGGVLIISDGVYKNSVADCKNADAV